MNRVDDPRDLESLLGAYALDACDPDEVEAIEAYLARTPSAAREVDRLRNAAAWVGATEALTPPPKLRATVFDIARARRRSPDQPDSVSELYETEMARMDALITGLPADALDRMTFNGLTVRHLVIHLAAQETMLAAAIGSAAPGVDIDIKDLEARTAAFVEWFRDRPIDEAITVWRGAVAAVSAWARVDDGAQPIRLFHLEMRREALLVNRAFETWIHLEDLREVLDWAPEPPPAGALHLMANLAVQSMPWALEITGRAQPGRTAHMVLTGDGGGEWMIPLSAASEPTTDADVTITAGVVDFCRLVGERLTGHELDVTVQGDATLADDLLAAAPAFATL